MRSPPTEGSSGPSRVGLPPATAASREMQSRKKRNQASDDRLGLSKGGKRADEAGYPFMLPSGSSGLRIPLTLLMAGLNEDGS